MAEPLEVIPFEAAQVRLPGSLGALAVEQLHQAADLRVFPRLLGEGHVGGVEVPTSPAFRLFCGLPRLAFFGGGILRLPLGIAGISFS